MSQITELPLLTAEPESLLIEDELGTGIRTASNQQSNTYTVTLSVNFGFMAGLADTAVGAVVLRVLSVVIAAGGFVISLAVIILAPMFPSLVSPAPPRASAALGEPLAASSSHHPLRRRHPAPATITVSVRRDPSIRPIIERRDSASPGPVPPARRVSFSPQSSTTSVPTLPDPPTHSQPGSSNGNGHAGPSTPAMRSVCSRVLEREPGSSYVLPTPPASITSVSSEADDTETAGVDEFGACVTASQSVGKRGKRTFPFSKRSKGKGKGKEAACEEENISSGLFGDRQREQSLGYIVEGADSLSRSSTRSKIRHSLFGSTGDEVLRESEGETSTHGTDRDDRASRTSAGEKEARRRSGLSFQDFKAAFGKRERRSSTIISSPGSYALSSTSSHSDRAELPSDGVPRTPQSAGAGIGRGRPSTAPARVSPRSASDELARAKHRNSPPLRLDATLPAPETERKEVQSPIIIPARAPKYSGQAPLFGGEVVIRDEGGRKRTRSTAIPGLYADAEVVRRW